MEKISETIFHTELMSELVKDLTDEEASDLKNYIDEFIEPIDSLTALISDMMSTESSKEKLAEDIINLFTPEGNRELKKCLGKN